MAVKGRQTLRRGASALRDGATMKLWDIEAPPGSTAAALESRAYAAALDSLDKLETHRAAAAASGKFTETGLQEDARRFAVSTLAPTLHRGRLEIAAAKKEAAERRAKLTLQPPDKTDLVGAMRRQEMRAWLRSLGDQARRDYIASHLEHLDPEMALAVIEAPSELSGVLGSDRKVLVDAALTAQHGADAISKVLTLERAVEIAEMAVESVRAEIARDVGVPDPHEFNQLAVPHEKSSSAPYLKKFNENGVEKIRVLKMNGNIGGTWSEATPMELSTGIYYANFQEFQKAHQQQQGEAS
jgi:hypothetical protein